MKKIFYISLALIFITISCDKVDAPYFEEVDNGGGNDSTVYVQKVLIEDYTAHFCVNCPRAALQLEDLVTAYGDKIIPLAVHVGFLAQPSTPPYELDLRTPVGDDLDNEFGCSAAGLPNGLISRTIYQSNILIGDGDWPSATSIILDKEPKLGIQLSSEIDTVNLKLGIDIQIKAIENIQIPLKVCAYIIENHIFGAQKDQESSTGEVINYEFNHVLRASFNGTWGETVSTTGMAINEVVNKSYTNFNINSEWDFHNLGAVVFVYDSLTNEVIQAESIEFAVN